MNVGRFVGFLFAPVLMLTAQASLSHAQSHETHMAPSIAQGPAPEESALVRIVRESTERFLNMQVAIAEGYAPQFGCVSGSDFGAMGVHLVNGPLVADPAIDVRHPELLVYEPMSNGQMRLVAADYLVLADAWNAHNAAPPQLMGQAFHLFDAPNRFGLPAFYTLHVWAWKDNPNGMYVNWNPNVSCDEFNQQS